MDSYDLFWEEARAITARRIAEEKRIQNDARLSDVGKKQELKKARDEYEHKKADLVYRFKTKNRQDSEPHQSLLNGNGKKQSFRARVRTKANQDSYLTSDEESHLALLEGIEEMTEAIRESTFVRSVASLDQNALREKINGAVQDNHTTHLKWLRNYVESRGGNDIPMIGAIDAALNANRPPSEKVAQKCIEKLGLYEQFFVQGLDLAEKTGEMPDFRGNDSDQVITREISVLHKAAQESK